MTPEDQQKLEEYCQGIAAILYRNAEAKNAEQLKTLEGIELGVWQRFVSEKDTSLKPSRHGRFRDHFFNFLDFA